MDVKDEEALVVGSLGLETDGEASGGGIRNALGADGCVYLEDCRGRGGICQVLDSSRVSWFTQEVSLL